MTTRATRIGLAAVLCGGLAAQLALVAAPASAEKLPGPLARPGLSPIGGPLLAGTRVVYRPAGVAVPPPAVVAESWVLADATTGEVLAAKAPHERWRPASTLKTLTAITLLPKLDPTKVYTATDADTRADGSRVGLVKGATYTIDDLWHALLLPSANDAAHALATANGGLAPTVSQMNAMARRLQALDTVAKTPSGLDANGQFSSAYDLALFARQAIALPAFLRVSGTTSYSFPGQPPKKAGARRPTYMIYGQNRLLNHGFRGTIAGKTGFTTQARRTFWVAVKRGDRTLIASLMRIGQPTEQAARSLITWGFAHAAALQPVGVLAAPAAGPGTAQTGGQPGAGAQAAALSSSKAASTSPGSSLWVWLVAIAAAVGGTLLLLRRRATVRRQGSSASRRDARRARAWS